jgi:diguanylate cyclase
MTASHRLFPFPRDIANSWRVVAEDVEAEEQLHFLQQEGCSEGQGYFFCRPVIAEKFAQFLERGVTEAMVH